MALDIHTALAYITNVDNGNEPTSQETKMRITLQDNGTKVSATVHRGGSYGPNSIYQGGAPVVKTGKIVINRGTFGHPDATAPCDTYYTGFSAGIEFDDGTYQSAELYAEQQGWPLISLDRAD